MALRDLSALLPALHRRDRGTDCPCETGKPAECIDYTLCWGRHWFALAPINSLTHHYTHHAYVVNVDCVNVFRVSMRMASSDWVTSEFKRLRERADMSLDVLAQAMGYARASSIQRYEDPAGYKKEYLDRAFVAKLLRPLVGKGEPPITANEVWALAGPEFRSAGKQAAEVAPHKDTVVELDTKAGAGGGGLVDLINVTDDGGNQISGEVVKDYWRIPEAYLRGELRIEASKALIVEVTGDSGYDPAHPHAPGSIFPGDRVIIDARDTRPSPPGPFLVYDGTGLVVKLCEPVHGSDPPTIRLLSRNPTYSPYTIALDDGHVIVGRVRGRISAM